jgi:hypothetical protein
MKVIGRDMRVAVPSSEVERKVSTVDPDDNKCKRRRVMEEIANPFTYPPSQYRLYTKRNLVLLGLLRSRSGTKLHDEVPVEEQRRLLADQSEPPVEWDLTRLERPRLDWIEEDGGHETFGDFWPVCSVVAFLVQLFPFSRRDL